MRQPQAWIDLNFSQVPQLKKGIQFLDIITMKSSLLAMIALASGAISQTTEDPGPSPTASVGCEPHGDHWYGKFSDITFL